MHKEHLPYKPPRINLPLVEDSLRGIEAHWPVLNDNLDKAGVGEMLALNNQVHYGNNEPLRREYAVPMQHAADQFYDRVPPITDWYHKHQKAGDDALKLAAEMYVAILGQPQLFIEGNHRTGNLVANWINIFSGKPPFVLSVVNALAYFAPSAEIKAFTDKSTWRGRQKLPKYRKSFLKFWQEHLEEKYLLK